MESKKTQTRSKRWNRRSSDGAAWGSSFDTDLAEENDDDDNDKRRSSCSLAWRRIVASEQLFGSREPLQITEEFRERIAAALRASFVTFVTFFLLIFSGQEYMPVAWIGNVIALSALKPSLGDTFLQVKVIFIPMIPTTMISWGISYLLGLLSTKIYSILLPFVVMFGSMIMILCPWPYITMKNLMLIIFYIIVASPLSLRYSGFDNDVIVQSEWFVPELLGTCTIGLCVALLVHLMMIPAQRSTTASRLSQRLVKQLEYETQKLLQSVSEYTSNIGKASSISRQSRTLIEFYVKSRERTLKKLEACLPAMRAEKSLRLPISSKNDNLDKVESFVACSKKQQKHAELLRMATTQQFLGEEFTTQNESVRGVKAKMSTNLGFAVEQLALAYVRSEQAFFFDSSDANIRNDKDKFHGLESCMESYRKAMIQAITDAEALLLNDDAASRSTTGPLIRQRVAFLAVFSFVHELCDMIAGVGIERPTDKVSMKMTSSRLVSTLKMPWLWGNLGKRRLAWKTAIGLGLASLWVAIPYLRGYIAYPNSVWVGITVASVSLESTGAVWLKCLDRLWGTLVAGGFAMLIGKVFEDVNGIVPLVALATFTFAATFLTNPDRPYASRYAATSVGSILYGSFDNGIAVGEYVPMRVMLIFVGVVTFLFVEMMLLPLSSRTIVQARSLQFFEDLENFLFDSSKVCRSVSTSKIDEDDFFEAEKDPLWMLREGSEKITLTDDLAKSVKIVAKTVALAKSELRSGIAEPSIGLNISLDVGGYENLLMEQNTILAQLDLLITTVKSLAGYYTHLPEDHPVRSLQWPALLSASLVEMAQQLSECVDKLRRVFPNGLLRPGTCEVSHVIRACAVFRNFEDVILSILTDVENRHASYVSAGSEVRYTPGFRLTLALAISSILTIGKSLNNCGKHLETIVQSFPIEDVKLNETPASRDEETNDDYSSINM